MNHSGIIPAVDAPYMKDQTLITTAMRDVILALIPVTIVAVNFYGLIAAAMVLSSVAAAALTGFLLSLIRSSSYKASTGSAAVTGMLSSLLFPASVSWWVPVATAVLAVIFGREIWGGIGLNRFNPALLGYVLMMYTLPHINPDIVVHFGNDRMDVSSMASPIYLLTEGMAMPSYLDVFFGIPVGSLSESSPLALLLGGIYLLYRRHINWRIPVTIFVTVFTVSLAIGQDPTYHLLSGGLILGAVFMATDWVTTPITVSGKLIFGIMIGFIVMIFRVFLPMTEGVAFAILLANLFVPAIDNATKHLVLFEPKQA